MSLPKILLYRAKRPARHFSPDDPNGSRSTGGHLEISSVNNQLTARVFIRFLAYFPEANLSSTSLSSILWKYSKTFHQQPENIQRLFRLQNCLSRKSSAPENIQRLFRLQNCLSRKSSAPENIQRLSRLQNCLSRKSSTISRKYSKTFWAAAINSSNQQQQSTAATSTSNQQQQLAATTSFHPISSIYTIHDDFR